MQVDPPPYALTSGRRAFRSVLTESVMVAVFGGLLAFTLNALSPRGLDLNRDHFPGAVRLPATLAAATNSTDAGQTTNALTASSTALVAARLKAKNLQSIGRDQMREFYLDPRYQQNLIVFVDARNEAEYQAGHIPGAHQLDHYRAADYLAAVLPICLTAERVIVYCLGGDCEDSEFAAVTLREVGIPNERIAVYAGGFTDWSTNGLPVEIGGRLSGQIREGQR